MRDLRALRKDSDSPYVFITERGGPLSTDTLAYIVREAGWKSAWMSMPIRTCCGTRPATSSPTREWTPA